MSGSTPRQVLERARGRRHEDGPLRLEPGLSPAELEAFAAGLAAPLPPEVRELLAFARGLAWPAVAAVDFRGLGAVEVSDLCPLGVDVAADGRGNAWVVDVDPHSGTWGPVLFACHDPPVLAWQAGDLAAFLDALLATDRVGAATALTAVSEEHVHRLWREAPWIDVPRARAADDPLLAGFARGLDPERFDLVDLRGGGLGRGFPWGRAGPDTELRRCGSHLLFAVERPRPLRRRLRDLLR